MKTIIIFSMFLMIGIAGEKPEAQKFEVTYTITYNSITLLEASELEEKIRKEHKDACKVSVAVKESNSYPVSSLIDSISSGYRTTLEWEGIK